jgi:hypothetical protein
MRSESASSVTYRRRKTSYEITVDLGNLIRRASCIQGREKAIDELDSMGQNCLVAQDAIERGAADAQLAGGA